MEEKKIKTIVIKRNDSPTSMITFSVDEAKHYLDMVFEEDDENINYTFSIKYFNEKEINKYDCEEIQSPFNL